MRRASPVILVLLALVLPAGRARAQAVPDTTVHVTYLAGDLVYVDAGREDGLAEGMQLRVERDGAEVAVLEVRHLASHRASCSVVEGGGPPQIGDVVRYRRRPAPAASEAPRRAIPAASRKRRGGLGVAGLRGRLGARYLSVRDQTGTGTGFSQPAFDVRLGGDRLNGGPLSVQVDARARRTYRTRPGGESLNDGRTRVYRMSAAYRTGGSPFRFVLGRQVSPDLASVSLFDGGLAAYEPGRWGLGIFAGAQPDGASYGLSTDILEAGAYARYGSAPGAATRWSATGGVVASQDHGAPNRDYLFLRGQLMSPRFFGYLAQELDVNRGWKTGAGEPLLTATSTYLSLRYRPAAPLELDAGYDNRRNVRLYRDRDTPETEFDDSYRRGIRAGVTVRPGSRLRLSLSGRTFGGGSSGETRSATVTARLLRLTPLVLDLGSRSTRYTGPLTRGWLHVVTAGAPLGRRRRLEVHVGRRNEDRFTGIETSAGTNWYGADLDLGVAAGWYLLLSLESTRGDVEKNDQLYSSLSYRF